MALNCIIGDMTLDKGKYIYNKAKEYEKEGKNNIIFVPSQARMSSEEEYLQKTGTNGMLNTDITTLSRYISKLLDEKYTSNKQYISDDEKRMHIKYIIGRNENNLSLFKNVLDKPSFIDMIISYMDSIKKENLDIDSIEKIDGIDELTKIKLKEIFEICEFAKENIADKYIDNIDMLDIFTRYIVDNRDKYNNTEIFFHGYNNFSKKELSVISSLLSLGVDVNVSLTISKNEINSASKPENMFEISYKTYKDLEKICDECGVKFNVIEIKEKQVLKEDINYLVKNIFNNEYSEYDKESSNVKIKLEKNSNTEIENIAKEIVGKLREDKTLRYRDFAIYTSNFEEYEFCIKRIFDEYEINYHFDDTSEVAFSNLTIYILLMLKLSSDGIDVNKLLLLMKTGLLDISKEDLNYFENYILEFGIKGYMINREFKKNNNENSIGSFVYDLKKINDIREKLTSYITKFNDELQARVTANEKVKTIYNHIIQNSVINRYAGEIDLITDEDIKEGNIRKQIIKAIYDIFDNIVNIAENEEISVQIFTELFEFGMKDRKIKTIPMTIDQVEICDINKTRILPKKHVYIIGAYENGLPNISTEDSIFSDKELDKLKENNIDIKQNSLSRTNMALFNVYMALSNVKESLTVTMPVSKITGEPLRIGKLINELKRILNISIDGNISYDDTPLFEENKMTQKVVFRNLLSNVVEFENLNDNQIEYLYSMYLHYSNKEEYKKILQYSRKDNNISGEILDSIYKDKLNSSVSRLEAFKRCPFSYYANYMLNLKPRKKYSLSVMDMGTLMHDCLEKFSKWIMERNLLWQEIVTDGNVQEKAKNKIDEIIEKIFEINYSKFKDNNRYIVLKASLKRKMFKIVKIIASSFNQSEFKPLGYEVEFRDGALYSPIEINLENGKTMYLVGKIDRIDSAVINDKVYLRIVDYKSSNKNISINDIKEGISLQLMTYMSALVKNKQNIDVSKDVIPAAINYFTLNADIKKLDEFTDDENKINKELIKAMKLKGIYISDVKVLESLDRKYKDTSSSFIDVNSRNINDKNKVVTEDEFKKECEKIQKILKDIGREITKGVIKINPKKCNGKLPCEYCDYSSICRKNIRA